MKKIIFVFIFLKSLASIAQPITTTWNGSGWSNNAPTASIEAIIEGVYKTATNGAVSTKKLKGNSGNLTVQNEEIKNASQFFKSSQVVVENNRIFLNATSPLGDFSQMAINYVDGATNGVDAFDAKYFNDGSLALNSLIDNTDYVIQGRALPFDATDLVPLSFYTSTAGNFTIAIDHVDGLFVGSQDIILKDNDTGIETDLKTGAYTFAALAGKTTSRFVLKYQKTTTTWNGSAWSNGAPTATIEAIIEGVYNTVTNGTISTKKLTLNSGILTVNSGNLTVQNGVINNAGATAIVIENNANLIQVNNTANLGAITIKRNSSFLKRLDYTLWSSPVANQNLLAFSPATILTRFYTYNTTTNLYNILANPASTAFTAGNGYLIRMPNTDPTTDYDSGIASLNFLGVFTGVPNNGAFSVGLVDGLATGLRYNLVGNPYPSPIAMSTFVTDNALNIESTLYFWRKTNGIGTAYCTWVDGPGTGTFTTNGNTQSVNPLGVIQTGQGFFVEAKSGATSLSFNNLQRVANTIGQFFRTKQVAETNRVWLNATNATGDFSQMAVTYTTAATQGIDAFDGKYFNDSAFALTSIINNSEYTIQGRALPFDPSDIVPLKFKTEKAGDYTIAIDHTDGLLATQDIYLVDSNTGIETNLKETAYTFNATVGVENSRFSLKYQKTLKVDAPAFNENSITVYKNKGVLYVNSTAKTINNIKVFDIQGRLIAEQKYVKATTAVLKDLKAIHQVLIVKISCEDNIEFTKKVVN